MFLKISSQPAKSLLKMWSKMKISDSWYSARASMILILSALVKFTQPFLMRVNSLFLNFSRSRFMRSQMLRKFFQSDSGRRKFLSLETVSWGRIILYRRDRPWNQQPSWPCREMKVIFDELKIWPFLRCVSPNKDCRNIDRPDPSWPTKDTTSPGLILSVVFGQISLGSSCGASHTVLGLEPYFLCSPSQNFPTNDYWHGLWVSVTTSWFKPSMLRISWFCFAKFTTKVASFNSNSPIGAGWNSELCTSSQS